MLLNKEYVHAWHIGPSICRHINPSICSYVHMATTNVNTRHNHWGCNNNNVTPSCRITTSLVSGPFTQNYSMGAFINKSYGSWVCTTTSHGGEQISIRYVAFMDLQQLIHRTIYKATVMNKSTHITTVPFEVILCACKKKNRLIKMFILYNNLDK